MRLGRWEKRALITLWWHDIDEVEYSEAKGGGKSVNEMRMQITLKTKCTAILTTQRKTKTGVGLSKTSKKQDENKSTLNPGCWLVERRLVAPLTFYYKIPIPAERTPLNWLGCHASYRKVVGLWLRWRKVSLISNLAEGGTKKIESNLAVTLAVTLDTK